MIGDDINENDKDILLSIIKEVIKDEVGASELQRAVEESQRRLRETERSFDETYSAQPQNVHDACAEIAETIYGLFGEYETALSNLSEYAHTFDKEILTISEEILPEITSKLNEAFFNFRQTALTAMGPTLIPGANLLISTAKKILAGQDLGELLDKQISLEGYAAEGILEEFGDNPEDAHLADFFEHYLDWIDVLSSINESGSVKNLESWIKGMIDLAHAYGLTLTETAEYEAGDRILAESPLAGAVITGARKLAEGKISTEEFLEHLKALRTQLDTLKFNYKMITGKPPASSRLEEEASLVGDTLQAFEEALDQYSYFIESRNRGVLEKAEETLIGVLEEFKESLEVFKELAEQEGKVPCIKCGHYNDPKSKICEKCSAMLPSANEDMGLGLNLVNKDIQQEPTFMQDTVMTDKVQELFTLAMQVSENKTPPEDLIKKINSFDESIGHANRLVETLRQQKAKIEIPMTKEDEEEAEVDLSGLSESDRLFLEVSNTFEAGVKEFKEGLDLLREFAEAGSVEAMQNGISSIWQGMGKLQLVQRVSGPSASEDALPDDI